MRGDDNWSFNMLDSDPLMGGGGGGGAIPKTNEIVKNICSCHNFSPLSSVQIIIIPACCLLCVL